MTPGWATKPGSEATKPTTFTTRTTRSSEPTSRRSGQRVDRGGAGAVPRVLALTLGADLADHGSVPSTKGSARR